MIIPKNVSQSFELNKKSGLITETPAYLPPIISIKSTHIWGSQIDSFR